MGYLGRSPTPSPIDSSDIPANSIDASKIIDGAIAVADVADNAITEAKIADAAVVSLKSGRKNLIINGDMQVAQRGTSVTGITSGQLRTCDRVGAYVNTGTWTGEQVSDSPDEFANSFKITCTAGAVVAAGDQVQLFYSIESRDLLRLAKGTSSAKSFTISFWAKSSKTGTSVLNVKDNTNSRHINSTYTVDVANTWEKKTITFAGDTAGVLGSDNTSGISLEFWLKVGSDNSSGTLQTSWAAFVGANRAAGTDIDIGTTTNDTFQIAGLQLEVGSVATDFEHRSYGEELALCQRYYQRITQAGGDFYIMASKGQSSDTTRFAQTLARPLRASPTISQGDGFSSWRCFRGTSGIAASTSTPTTVGFVENAGFVSLQVAGFSGLTDNFFYGTSPVFSGSGYFDMDSEL